MGSNPNFKSFGNNFAADGMGNGGGNGSQPPGNFPLARQSSVYSLTFEEFQNSMGGIGKDFGSMNMDELLKNIWSAEENQTMQAATTAAAGGLSGSAVGGGGGQEGIRRQGSLTLPRTLSQRTVDEVWKDILKEYGSGNGTRGANMPQRQQTLGEVTLEEFLLRAGVVREEAQLAGKVNGNSDFFGDLSRTGNNPGMGLGFQQNKIVGLPGNGANQMPMQASNLPLNVNGVRSNEPQPQQQQQQPILPKQPNVGYPSQMPLQTSPAIRSRIMGMGDQGISGGLVQGGGMGMVGLGMVGTGSPANQLSSDGVAKSNGDTSSVSPVPYVFSGGVRGRRATGTIEKVVERRQRRMIKNRESAARSRARKQAYTMELEAEVAKLKEENQQLRKKQEEMMEMQKNQAMEMMHMQQGGKKRRLRRTQTGPW